MNIQQQDYEIPDITFNLWYRLSEELYRRGDDSLTALFAPYIERLIAALSKHCQVQDHLIITYAILT